MSIYIPFAIIFAISLHFVSWKITLPIFLIGTAVAWYYSDKVMCRYNYRVKFYKKAKKIFDEYPNKRSPEILKQIQDSKCGMEVSKQLEEEYYIAGYDLNEKFIIKIVKFLVNLGYDPKIVGNSIYCDKLKIKLWTPRKYSIRVLHNMKKDIRGLNERLCCFNT